MLESAAMTMHVFYCKEKDVSNTKMHGKVN